MLHIYLQKDPFSHVFLFMLVYTNIPEWPPWVAKYHQIDTISRAPDTSTAVLDKGNTHVGLLSSGTRTSIVTAK